MFTANSHIMRLATGSVAGKPKVEFVNLARTEKGKTALCPSIENAPVTFNSWKSLVRNNDFVLARKVACHRKLPFQAGNRYIKKRKGNSEMLKIEWHGKERVKLYATANGCQITKDVYGNIDELLSNAIDMHNDFAKSGVKSVDIISASTGEVIATISENENPDDDDDEYDDEYEDDDRLPPYLDPWDI